MKTENHPLLVEHASLPPLPHYRLRWVAASMAFICTFVFTGGPLMAQTYDAHRKRTEREQRILKNLGLKPSAGNGSSSGSRLSTLGSRPVPPHAWDLHKPVELGEVGRLSGALRTVVDRIARTEARLGRDPSAAQDLQYLYKQRDTVEHMLGEMGVDVAKMKANAPKQPRYTRPLGPIHKEVKPIPRLPRVAPISREASARATGVTGVAPGVNPGITDTKNGLPLPAGGGWGVGTPSVPAAASVAGRPSSFVPRPSPTATQSSALSPQSLVLRQVDADLAETPETRRGPWVEEVWAAIVAVTERTTITALDIYQHVYNTIDIEWYYGSKKGAEATHLDMSGNDFDQASLLIALLRAKDIPARYVYSTVQVDGQTAKNLTGADSVAAAYLIFQNAGIPVGGLSSDGFTFEHVYVSAYVPRAGTAGLGIDGAGARRQWVKLDPWAKELDWTHEHDLAAGYVFDKTAFLNATTDISAVEWAEVSFREHLKAINDGCTAPGNVGKRHTIVAELFPSLPDVLPLHEVAALEEFAEVPDEYRHKVTYSLLNQWGGQTYSYETLVAETIHKPVRPGVGPLSQADADLIAQYGGIENVPYYMIQLVPTLYVADQAVATASMPFVSGEELTFVVELTYPNFTPDRIEHAIVSGGEYVDVLLSGKVPIDLLTAISRQQSAVREQIESGTGDLSGLKAEGLRLTAYLMALTYYDMVFKNQNKVERYLGAVFPALTVDSFGMKSLSVLRGYFGEPMGVSAGAWMVDIVRYMVAPSFYTGSTRDARLALDLVEMDSSVMEHRVMPPVIGEEGVSAVKVMHASAANGWEIFLVNRANWEETRFLYLHQHEQAFLDAIEDLVNEGASVYVPRYPITIGSWRGSGYIGGGQYIISGGTGSASPVAISGGCATGNTGSGSGGAGGGCSCTCAPGPSQVDLANGNYFFDETDMSVNSRGIPVVLSRTYNSITARDAGLGYGWSWSYGIRAFEAQNGVVTILRENGREDAFTPTGTSDYYNPPGVYDTLTKDAGGFSLRSKEGITHLFGSDGKLLSISEPNGNTVTVQYANGLPATVTDAAGRMALTFQTSNGHITGVTDLYGRTVTFTYSGVELVSATDVLGNAEAYSYDSAHKLIAKTDKNGNTVYVYYDQNGRWSRSVDTEGYIRSVEYDFITKTAKYTDANGNTEQYGWDANGAKTLFIDGEGNKVEWMRDENKNILEQKDARGNVSRGTFDNKGNALTQTDALRNTTTYTYDPDFNRVLTVTDAEGKTSSNTYTSVGNLLTSTDPAGNETSYGYNQFGQPTEIHKPGGALQTLHYDEQSGNITGMGDCYGNLTQIGYDGFGNLASFTDAAGNTRTMVSDAAGRVTSMTDASGNTTSFTFDANGNRLTSTDAAGKMTTFGYDKKNRLVSATDPQGNTTRTMYDGNSNVIARTDAKGSTTTFTFNKGNQLVKTVDALGNAVRQGYCADVGCPSCGGGGSSGVCSATDALGNTTVTRFDSMGRPTETISPTGSVTATQFDSLGRQSKTIDALGNETRFIYDDLGRLWKVIDALGGVTEYAFDERGNRTSVKDANGGVTSYVYDLENRLVSETNPIGITTTYTYTPTGRRATKTDGNGVTTTYQYTAEGRQSRVDFPDGTFKEYRFDNRGNKVYEANQDVVQTYEFDDLNRVVSYTQTNIGGISKTLRFEFDANGNRTKMIDAEGGVTTYEYDRNNRLVKVTDPDGDVTRLEYDAAGRRSKLILGNGVWAAYEYDASSRVTSILYRSRTNEILMGFAYGHDLNGNRLYKRFADGTQETYSYDAGNRLVHVTYRDGKFEDFSYDLLGNRIAHNKDGVVTISTFNAFNQIQEAVSYQPSAISTTTFLWDGNGNLLSETSPAGVKSYLWDFDNRLRQVTMPDGTTSTYTYAASGLRVKKVEGATVTQQLLDGPSVTTEYDETATRNAFYLQNPRKIDEFFSATILENGQPKKLWPMVDALGSVYGLRDKFGTFVSTFNFEVYGARQTSGTAELAFGFTGREYEPRLATTYHRQRWLHSAVGIWHQPDPLGFAEGRNLFRYVLNNPTNRDDPEGLFYKIEVEGSTDAESAVANGLYAVKGFVRLAAESIKNDVFPFPYSVSGQGKTFVWSEMLGDFPPTATFIVKCSPSSSSLWGRAPPGQSEKAYIYANNVVRIPGHRVWTVIGSIALHEMIHLAQNFANFPPPLSQSWTSEGGRYNYSGRANEVIAYYYGNNMFALSGPVPSDQ